MPAAWDTTLASQLHPESDALEHVFDQVVAGGPVLVAAPAILEVAYGYQRKAEDDPRFGDLLGWFTRLIESDAFNVVPLDGRAALVAGCVRGLTPHPPPRRDRRSKTMRQAAWLLDIQIAATAFAAGLDIATANRDDFETLANLLAQLFPDAPRLAVVDAPF